MTGKQLTQNACRLCAALLLTTIPWIASAQTKSDHRARPFTKLASNATYGCRRPHGYGLFDAKANKTFVCWNGGGMSVFGRAYDHAKHQWSRIKEIHRNEYFGKWDYHDYPNMAQAPDGRLIVTWAKHVRYLEVARAKEPHNLTGEWEHRVLSKGLQGYPIIFTFRDTVYIFYIMNADRKWPQRTFGYVKSTDSGATWSENILAIDSQKKDPDKIDEVYMYHFHIEPADGQHPDRVQFNWVMRGGPKGHNKGSRNLYFAYFLPDTGTWQSVDGTDLGDWIDLDEMLAHCIVRKTGPVLNGRAINSIVSSYLPDAAPFVMYEFHREAWQATWTGKEWRHDRFDKRLNVRAMRRMPDGSHRLLVAPPGQPSVLIYEGPGEAGKWRKTFEHKIPYEDGANRTWSMCFIDNGRPEVDILMSQLDNTKEQEDVSGKWPVWVLRTDMPSGLTPAP